MGGWAQREGDLALLEQILESGGKQPELLAELLLHVAEPLEVLQVTVQRGDLLVHRRD